MCLVYFCCWVTGSINWWIWDAAPSVSWHLCFSPSIAETERLLGILAFFEGETSSWLNRFLLTFVTSDPEIHHKNVKQPYPLKHGSVWRRLDARANEKMNLVLPLSWHLHQFSPQQKKLLIWPFKNTTQNLFAHLNILQLILNSLVQKTDLTTSLNSSHTYFEIFITTSSHSSRCLCGHLDLTKTLRRLSHAAMTRQHAAP